MTKIGGWRVNNKERNILFIMTDQWRADCLSCSGHPLVKTPNLDKLAENGVRFERAYVQTAVCGPSRMCFYTGRHTHAHRSSWNGVPLPEDERGIGHYFRDYGYDPVVAGKTHHIMDKERLPQLGACGFNPDDDFLQNCGMRMIASRMIKSRHCDYNEYLREKGYISDNPLNEYALTVETHDKRLISAWDFKACPHPLRVRMEHSPPAYLTDKAISYMQKNKHKPWMMHLSYLYPHWPIAAPAPYNSLYNPDDVDAPVRISEELNHPILGPFRKERRSLPFDNEWVWRNMRATYYGMITLVDYQLGRLFDFMKEQNLMDNTVILFTSDHGEYMGDHWLFEKELFYEQAIRVPLILYHPGSKYDATRGKILYEFIQSIDILPALLDAVGIPSSYRIQGKSFLPLVAGSKPNNWQKEIYGDWDYQFYKTGEILNVLPQRRKALMIRDENFKYVHFMDLPDMLFDLENDPMELANLARNPKYKEIINKYRLKLLDWRMANEDRSRSGWLYEKVGMKGISLESDRKVNYDKWD